MDNDTSLIWESFIQEKKKDKELKVRKGNIGQDKPGCISTGERIEKPKKGKGSYNRKEKHSKELEEGIVPGSDKEKVLIELINKARETRSIKRVQNMLMQRYGVRLPSQAIREYVRMYAPDITLEEAAEDSMVGVDTLTVGDKMPQDLLHVLSMFDQGVMRADDFFQFPESEQIIGWGWVDTQPTSDQYGNSWVSLTDKGTKSTKSGTISE